ncbi:MAG: hypothetical protein QXU75_08315 [Candidatus Methanomethylicaceae archaeon]
MMTDGLKTDVRLIRVHGRCGKCSLYVTGEAEIGKASLWAPEGAFTTELCDHFVVLCPKCAGLINLIPIDHDVQVE